MESEMRDIEFRCWNEHGKVMHDWSELVEGNKIHLLNAKNPTYKIMQFTGLKDKNGVEIYEGDIVEIHSEQRGGYSSDEDRDVTWRGCVHYRPSSGFGLNMVLFMDESMDLFEKHHSLKNIVQYKSKVIGNIHENPELLN